MKSLAKIKRIHLEVRIKPMQLGSQLIEKKAKIREKKLSKTKSKEQETAGGDVADAGLSPGELVHK